MSARKSAPPEFFFCPHGGNYHVRVNGRFMPLDKASLQLHLRHAGFSEKNFNAAKTLNEIENAIFLAQCEKAVDYAGPLAGHKVGLFETGAGAKVLVTHAPRSEVFEVPSPPRKKLKYLELFLQQLFEEEQLPYFYMWLKFARAALRKGDFAPGQLIVVAGESGCGKGLLHAVITECLGGRSAKPYRYMSAKTEFNADLAGAEHLYMEDEQPSTSTTARRQFGNALKEMAVCTEMSVHAKGRQAITLPTYRRLSASVNCERENLMFLPVMDESIQDKISLFKVHKVDFGKLLNFKRGDMPDRNEIWRTMAEEVPALVHMLHGMRCPEEMRDDRYGVRAYHNAELMEELNIIAPETRLLDLIDQILFEGKDASKDPLPSMSAEELEQRLLNSPFRTQVDKLLYYSSACGQYLKRLMDKYPARIDARRSKGRTKWIIRRPSE